MRVWRLCNDERGKNKSLKVWLPTCSPNCISPANAKRETREKRTTEDAPEVLRVRRLLNELVDRVLDAELLVELLGNNGESSIRVVRKSVERPRFAVVGALDLLRHVGRDGPVIEWSQKRKEGGGEMDGPGLKRIVLEDFEDGHDDGRTLA